MFAATVSVFGAGVAWLTTVLDIGEEEVLYDTDVTTLDLVGDADGTLLPVVIGTLSDCFGFSICGNIVRISTGRIGAAGAAAGVICDLFRLTVLKGVLMV